MKEDCKVLQRLTNVDELLFSFYFYDYFTSLIFSTLTTNIIERILQKEGEIEVEGEKIKYNTVIG